MRPTTLDELAWLHDCVLWELSYDTSETSSRSIKLRLQCPSDLGYAPWEGKELLLVAGDVAAAKHTVWGVAGPEAIDAVRPGVSEALKDAMAQARTSGVRFPDLAFTIYFHSGSDIEIVCGDLQVDI